MWLPVGHALVPLLRAAPLLRARFSRLLTATISHFNQGANLKTASFFDADLANSNFKVSSVDADKQAPCRRPDASLLALLPRRPCTAAVCPTAAVAEALPSRRAAQNAQMAQVNLEMADLSDADLTNADLTEAYLTGAVLNGPKGALTKIDNTDWTDAQLCAPRRRLRTALLALSRPVVERPSA
mgnify:CR=1 FL=1